MAKYELDRRLKEATGPDCELDALICAELRYTDSEHQWVREWAGEWKADGRHVRLLDSSGGTIGWWRAEPVTGSLDAVTALAKHFGYLAAYDPILFLYGDNEYRVLYEGFVFKPDPSKWTPHDPAWLRRTDGPQATSAPIAILRALLLALMENEE